MDQPPATTTTPTTTRFAVLPWLAVAALLISWAGSFPATTVALRGIDPVPLIAARFGLASIVAGSWLLMRAPRNLTRIDYGSIIFCGAVGLAAGAVLMGFAQQTISPGAASFIVGAQPLFMVMLAVAFLGETFSRWSWVGAVVGFAGITTVALGQPGGLNFGEGSTLALAAVMLASIMAALQRPLLRKNNPFTVTSALTVAGGIAMLPWLPEAVRQLSVAPLETIAAVAFLTVFTTMVGQGCWTYVIRSFGAARAGQFLYLLPLVATALAWVLLGDLPRWTTLVGGAITLAGVIIVNSWGRRKVPPIPV